MRPAPRLFIAGATALVRNVGPVRLMPRIFCPALMMVEGSKPLSRAEKVLLPDIILSQEKEAVEVVLWAKIFFQVVAAELFLHLGEHPSSLLRLLIGQEIENQEGPCPRRLAGEKEGL